MRHPHGCFGRSTSQRGPASRRRPSPEPPIRGSSADDPQKAGLLSWRMVVALCLLYAGSFLGRLVIAMLAPKNLHLTAIQISLLLGSAFALSLSRACRSAGRRARLLDISLSIRGPWFRPFHTPRARLRALSPLLALRIGAAPATRRRAAPRLTPPVAGPRLSLSIIY